MEGINRGKHQNLTGSIASYVQFLTLESSNEASEWRVELTAKQERLNELHREYLALISKLEAVTAIYHEEANSTQIRLLCRRAKKLKGLTDARRYDPKYISLPDPVHYYI
jgi:hypothetical protein